MPEAMLSVDDPLYWIVNFENFSHNTEFHFYQLLNDYRLREVIEQTTGGSSTITNLVISQLERNTQ